MDMICEQVEDLRVTRLNSILRRLEKNCNVQAFAFF